MDQFSFLSDLKALLSEAVKKVPSIRYAQGVAGVGAAAAIVYTAFRGDARAAVLGTVITIGLMIVLLIFARLTQTKSKNVLYAGILGMWVILGLFLATAIGLWTSFFFGWPQLSFLESESPECLAGAKKRGEVSMAMDNFITEQCVLANHISKFVDSGQPDDWKSVNEKAKTYYIDVQALDQKISTDSDVHAALSSSNFINFRILLDEKQNVVTGWNLTNTTPPSDRKRFENAAEKLRDYATKARTETASLQTVTLPSCRKPARLPPVTTAACTKPN